MSAVLNVVRGSVALGRNVVTLVEEGLVGFIEFFLAGKTMPFALHMRQSDKQNLFNFSCKLTHVPLLRCHFFMEH
jgi:hypothetical protein